MEAGAVLEVGGAPPGTPEELLVLYFESRRRSGGGPVRSCQRLGPLLFLTFESARDAQNVLSRGSHRLGELELGVRAAPPWDPRHLLLGGLEPRDPPECLEPRLEPLLGRPRGTFGVCRGPAPGWALLSLRDPLSPTELAAAEQRAQQRAQQGGPGGSALALLRLPQTPSVLVRAAALALSRDLLELYFENRRSGGGSVQDVRLLPGGSAAIVTFQELAAAQRVLQRPHRLQDTALALAPHYPFLEPPQGDAEPPPDVEPPPEMEPPSDTEPPPETEPPSDTEPPPETEPPSDTNPPDTNLLDIDLLDVEPPPDTDPPPNAAPPPAAPPPAPARLEVAEPAEPQASSPVPGEPPAAVLEGPVHGDAAGDQDMAGEDAASDGDAAGDEDVTIEGWWQEGPAQDEVLVPAEPGAVRYLQQHYQDLLGSIADVSLLPLEGEDVAGFRVRGEPGRCRAAAEFVQSLLGSVGTQTVTLRFPGVARFLRDAGGQSVLRQLERRYQCVAHLHGTAWSPPDPQLELLELLPPSCQWDPPPAALPAWHRDLPDDADEGDGADGHGADGDAVHSNIEEIKELLAALRPGEAAGDGAAPLPPGDVAMEQEPEADPLAGSDTVAAAEEEAQLALAVQRSMESSWREDEELARATALSLRCQRREEEEEDEAAAAGLLAALEASLEEALPAADAAQVTLFCAFERDVSAAPRELERALCRRLRAREVASERLRALPGTIRPCLALLQRRHAVRLALRAGTATLHGFAEYTAAAARDLARLLRHLPERDPPAACWVRWDRDGTAVPYGPEAAALLERAWQRREHRLELLLDGRPVTVDLRRMEELDVGNTGTAAVSRSCPPAGLLGPEAPGPEDEVRLLPLPEDSPEFREAVSHFYTTLDELGGTVAVVKVQKLIHPLLYEQYRLKKGSMERGSAAGTAVERVLFHGTTESSSREICLHGFNRSFCGKNAALYGLGVYFAARAALSAQDRYSPRGPDGSKFVFVAKVLTGAFAAGAPGLRVPPLRPGQGPPRRYDSVVDDPRRPGIFVIFNDTQAYPQYLLTCRHRGDPP